MLQSVKVDDEIDAAHDGSKDEGNPNTFWKERNIFLELQEEDGRDGEDQDEEESDEGDCEWINFGQPLHDDVG